MEENKTLTHLTEQCQILFARLRSFKYTHQGIEYMETFKILEDIITLIELDFEHPDSKADYFKLCSKIDDLLTQELDHMNLAAKNTSTNDFKYWIKAYELVYITRLNLRINLIKKQL